MDSLQETARALVAPARGILAADESTGTIKKRFDAIGVENTEEHRRQYRQLLFSTPSVGEYISGVILYDETIRQANDDGVPFTRVLQDAGVIPGIKVDLGAKPLALFPQETVTEGLDGLRERLQEYGELGARFAKWRATVFIGEGLPTDFALEANGHAMARYAALCQEAGIVPIVEPEVLMDGDHHLDACERVTARTLQVLFAQLHAHRVDLPGTLLKVNMVLCGKGCPRQAGHAEVAEATVRCLARERSRGGARRGLPLRRTVGRRRHGPSQRDEPLRAASLGALVQLRPRAPDAVAGGMARRPGERAGRPGRAGAPRAHERAGAQRRLHGRSGGLRRVAAGLIQRRRDLRPRRSCARPPVHHGRDEDQGRGYHQHERADDVHGGRGGGLRGPVDRHRHRLAARVFG